MGWKEDYKIPFTIRAGDGQVYTFKWKDPSISREYNTALFDYVGVTGTEVKRAKPKGRRLTLELYMDGDDHLDRARAFEISARDSRAWVVTHPAYGQLTVQPLSLFMDNRDANVTKFSVSVVETIVNGGATARPVVRDKILMQKVAIDDLQLRAYALTVVPTTADVQAYKGDMTALYAEGSKRAGTKIDTETYFNAFTAAYSKLDNLVDKPFEVVRKCQQVVNAPYLFAETVQRRIETFVAQVEQLRRSLAKILNPNDKRRYETNMGGIVSSMCAASVEGTDGSYKTRADVLAVADTIADTYEQYMVDMDGLQTETGGADNAYSPDPEAGQALRMLVGYTLNNLLDTALEGRQERVIILDRRRAVAPLVYELMGDDPDDEKLAEFIEANGIGRKELFMLDKGREVRYFV